MFDDMTKRSVRSIKNVVVSPKSQHFYISTYLIRSMNAMNTIRFRAKVSKGSKFSQIYVPKNVEVGAGDLVEVRLVEKRVSLYSHDVKELPVFKQKIIESAVRISLKHGAEDVFVVGSFLSGGVEYRDIDVLLIVKDAGDRERISSNILSELIHEIPLKFHVFAVWRSELDALLKSCPLTRSMIERYISTMVVPKKIDKVVDEKRIFQLLMLPEDCLDVDVESRTLFDCLRRVFIIESFLLGNNIAAVDIIKVMEMSVGKSIVGFLRNNNIINGVIRENIRNVLRKKIVRIKELVRRGKKA